MISLVVALALFGSPLSQEANLADTDEPTVSTSVAAAASADAARSWVALVDDGEWARSWNAAGIMFKGQVTEDQWAATIVPVRAPLGAVASRAFRQVTDTTSLPGAPDGEYELIEFATDFANREGAVETVVMMKESAGWKVVGYFIR